MKRWHLMTTRRLEELIEERLEDRVARANRDYESDLLMKQANITALQAQINPHFLYNALECIRAQAVIEGSEEIAAVTHALSRFFRYNIGNMGNLITLKDEFENVRNYILIQQFRFRDRLTLVLDYDPEDLELLDCLLPKLVMQPVIENSILHGFKDMSEGAVISVKAKRTEKHACITISDNGRGMDFETLSGLQEKLTDSGPIREREGGGSGSGIALQNVNRRFVLYFGREYAIQIFSTPGEGTDVEFFFPLNLPRRDSNEE